MSVVRRPHGDDGQVLVMVALMMVGVVSVVGLVSDGGLVFAQRRDLQNVADAAAAAGAMQIDEAVYRSSGEVVLDEQLARDAAALYWTPKATSTTWCRCYPTGWRSRCRVRRRRASCGSSASMASKSVRARPRSRATASRARDRRRSADGLESRHNGHSEQPAGSNDGCRVR